MTRPGRTLERTWAILGLEVKDCQHGKGVFALRAFKKEELVSVLRNQVFVRSTQSKGYALRIGRTKYWDASDDETESWTFFIDHSSMPNIRLLFNPEIGRVTVVAIRRIKAGEELFINYKAYYYSNPVFSKEKFS